VNKVQPFSGYRLATQTAEEDAELTHVGPETSCGEYLRRFWHPVALSTQLTDLPLAIRVMGEDLVVFRDRSDRVGVLHRQCCHRRASLEYGRVEELGIRCCYHGWLFDIDGRVLEAPAEPDDSPIPNSAVQGAYPALEVKGLVFAYLGPPGEAPEFHIYDTHDLPGDTIVLYTVHNPCNWLQVYEQASDPTHSVFLHSRMSGTHFAEAWGALPLLDYRPTDDGTGLYVLNLRVWDEFVWVRHLESVLPNSYRVPDLFQDPTRDVWFARAALTAWVVPVDDTKSIVFGWRHYNDELDLAGKGDPSKCGINSVDFLGQTGARTYEETQRTPSDFEVLNSQGRIAIHALEHLTSSDGGVALLRQMLRQAIRNLRDGRGPPRRDTNHEGTVPTISSDVIFRPGQGEDMDPGRLRALGDTVNQAVINTMLLPPAERRREIERCVKKAVSAV
jgi:nitrite reductase/ring-hydroxylating ferredoxin subunit